MVLRLLIVVCLPLATIGFLFPSSGGGCCCNSAPACGPAVSSCGGCGSSGYAPADYSGNNFLSNGYGQQPLFVSNAQSPYVAAPQASYSASNAGGYVKSPDSYGPVFSTTAASSYSVPANYNSLPGYNSASIPASPPNVQTALIEDKSIQHAASGSRLQAVEEEIVPKAESNAITANATANIAEPSPPIEISLLKITNDTECNNEELRDIIDQNMSENLNSSKRLIQVAAEEKFGGRFDVICSTSDFSYVTNTELFCQQTQSHVSCYAYRQL